MKGVKRRSSKLTLIEKRGLFGKRASSRIGILEGLENLQDYSNEQWLTDEPSEVLIGLDDLDDDFLDRLDLQEAKMTSLETMWKEVERKAAKIDIDLTLKMKATLADANTLKEETKQLTRTLKREKHTVVSIFIKLFFIFINIRYKIQ